MEVRRYVSELLYSNMYLIIEGDRAIVVDPFRDVSMAKGLQIDRIILTHEHYDHISGVNLWKKETGAPVLCSRICADNICDPRKNLARYFRDFCELQTWVQIDEFPRADPDFQCLADEWFENEKNFVWMDHRWKVFEIPGHSRGSIGILVDEALFFSGDSLMENKEIELRLPGGSKKLWKEKGERRIRSLPEGMKVYPGHFKPFLLEDVEDFFSGNSVDYN